MRIIDMEKIPATKYLKERENVSDNFFPVISFIRIADSMTTISFRIFCDIDPFFTVVGS